MAPNLAKVSDPAAGSGGIEALTSELCARAWELFQQIEKGGGIWPTLESNVLQRQVSEVRAARERNVARRKDVITGVNDSKFARWMLRHYQKKGIEAPPLPAPSP